MALLISTKGRYALRTMLDIVENQDETTYLPLKDIAKRQDISDKYLEIIVKNLVQSGLLVGTRGKKGGYRLAKPAAEYNLGEIIRSAEGSISPVACLEAGAEPCPRADGCKTLPIWQKLDTMTNDFLDSIQLVSLLE